MYRVLKKTSGNHRQRKNTLIQLRPHRYYDPCQFLHNLYIFYGNPASKIFRNHFESSMYNCLILSLIRKSWELEGKGIYIVVVQNASMTEWGRWSERTVQTQWQMVYAQSWISPANAGQKTRTSFSLQEENNLSICETCSSYRSEWN